MSRPLKHGTRETGATLTTMAFATAVLLMGLGTLFLVTSRSNLELIHHQRLQAEATALAEAGIERGLERLRRRTVPDEFHFDLGGGRVAVRITPGDDDTWQVESEATPAMETEEPIRSRLRARVERSEDQGRVRLVVTRYTRGGTHE